MTGDGDAPGSFEVVQCLEGGGSSSEVGTRGNRRRGRQLVGMPEAPPLHDRRWGWSVRGERAGRLELACSASMARRSWLMRSTSQGWLRRGGDARHVLAISARQRGPDARLGPSSVLVCHLRVTPRRPAPKIPGQVGGDSQPAYRRGTARQGTSDLRFCCFKNAPVLSWSSLEPSPE